MTWRAAIALALLVAALWVLRRWRTQRGGTISPAADTGAESWDPWTVLGIAPGATPAEVRHAYRQQMKRYHPDRVASLGADLQKVAHSRTRDIQRAYEEIIRSRSSGMP